MAIVFSAIVPHSPILIPAIGKENLLKLKDTQRAYDKIANDIMRSEAEVVLLISPHGPMNGKSFVMNLSPEFKINFEEFGDLVTKKTLRGDVGLAYKIREQLETKAPLQLISEENLDHGSSIPLFLLSEKIPNIKVVPVYYSGLNFEAHYEFGKKLQRELIYNNEKIAIIASADLSHSLSKDSPAKYAPRAKKFDQKVISSLQKNKIEELLNIDSKLVMEAKECGFKSIILLLGILNNIKYSPHLLSYEAPFGVGYMTMSFKM